MRVKLADLSKIWSEFLCEIHRGYNGKMKLYLHSTFSFEVNYLFQCVINNTTCMVLKYFKKHFIYVKIVAVFDIEFRLPLQHASIWPNKNWPFSSQFPISDYMRHLRTCFNLVWVAYETSYCTVFFVFSFDLSSLRFVIFKFGYLFKQMVAILPIRATILLRGTCILVSHSCPPFLAMGRSNQEHLLVTRLTLDNNKPRDDIASFHALFLEFYC